ncbi:MAG: hypothetical protein MHM6MM_006190 [Cercozoa sp. M6MM]
MSLLHKMVHQNRIPELRLLLQRVPLHKVEFRERGLSALELAVVEGRVEALQVLLRFGAAYARDEPAMLQPVHMAAISNRVSTMNVLLGAKPNLVAQRNRQGLASMHYACFHAEPDMVECIANHTDRGKLRALNPLVQADSPVSALTYLSSTMKQHFVAGEVSRQMLLAGELNGDSSTLTDKEIQDLERSVDWRQVDSRMADCADILLTALAKRPDPAGENNRVPWLVLVLYRKTDAPRQADETQKPQLHAVLEHHFDKARRTWYQMCNLFPEHMSRTVHTHAGGSFDDDFDGFVIDSDFDDFDFDESAFGQDDGDFQLHPGPHVWSCVGDDREQAASLAKRVMTSARRSPGSVDSHSSLMESFSLDDAESVF